MTKKQLDAAFKASTTIVDNMDSAAAKLRTGNRPFNGFGILADPSFIRGQLADAKKQIDEALAVYSATKWPTRQDYDAAEVTR